MAYTLFISDLHLCETRPSITQAFIQWLSAEAGQADALYILGDFFEYWAGDDALKPDFHAPIMEALKTAITRGTPIYLMHGNRDFLMGADFAADTGVALLADPLPLQLYGQSVLLSHGDIFCTDDVDYMAFRQQVRQSEWQQQFLSQSVADRQAFIATARQQSEANKSNKSMTIMDVNDDAVNALFKQYDYPPILIHGHTHRPAVHHYQLDGHDCQRYVLGDWYEQGSCLKMTQDGQLISEQVTIR